MSSYQVIEDVQEQLNTSVVNNNNCSSNSSAVVQHQIEKKRSIRTVGDWKRQNPLTTTTATASSSKISVTSTAEGKSVVSSVSMSLERRDSIHYVPQKIAPCIIPAGQSTVIHLDNYTHFMAQRVTTTKTAIKRSEIISEVQQNQKDKTLPSSSSGGGSKNSGARVGLVDVDLKVVLAGVSSSSSTSPHSSRKSNKTLNMNKQKMLDTKPVRSKARGRKNSLALEYSQEKELNNMVDIKVIQEEPPSTNLKSILKKPKPNRRRKLFKPRATRKSKIKNKNLIEEDNTTEKQSAEVVTKVPISSHKNTPPANESKILSPCTYTMQFRKCLNEMTCPYLHSDFPCKYYYLNLKCPLDFKCQYMHNGPLEPELMEALRNHILNLLSTKPTVVETYFIQQLHNIEDLSQRLQSFQKTHEQPQQVFEVIEVMDDDEGNGGEESVLVIDESSGEVNDNNLSHAVTSATISTNDSQITTASNLQPIADKLDIVYQNFKETNNIIDEIDQKLKNLKNTTNMTANEKIHELQNIYEILREQGKRLPIYENLNTVNSEESSKIYNKITQTNTADEQQQHIVLVNPEIINDIQIAGSQENHVMTLTDDDEVLETTISNVPQESGIEIIGNEILPQVNGSINNLTNENLTESFNDNNNKIDEMTNFKPKQQSNDDEPVMNMDQESVLTNNFDSIENNAIENIQNENNEETRIADNELKSNLNKEIIDNESIEEINLNAKLSEMESGENLKEILEQSNFLNAEQSEMESEENLKEILEKSISLEDLNNTQIQEDFNNLNNTEIPKEQSDLNNTSLLNEALELAITSDEKEVIESHIEEEQQNSEDINEEESPAYEQISTTKSLKRSHIRLRSHTQQDIIDSPKKDITEKPANTTLESIKPIKTRRLRLPKSTQKTVEKPNNEECQINADVINKLIKSTEKTETPNSNTTSPNESTFLQDVEIPLTQNVILTKRFLKKAKAKLEKQSDLNESILKTPTKCDIEKNVEQNMFVLHHEDTKNFNNIENIDVNQLTQTSDDSQPLNPSQDPLNVDNETDNTIEDANNIQKTSNKNRKKSEPIIKIAKNRRISFENPSSSSATINVSNFKEQFHLGTPHVVLTKLKTNILTATNQKDNIQADSTTTNTNANLNPLVTSSSPSNLLAATGSADDKSTQKRHSFTSEYDLDSSVKENKYLKIDNVKVVRKVNFDTRKRSYSEQSASSKEEGEFDTDSSDEKLTIADALQTSSSASSTGIEPSTTHKKTTTKHYYHPAAFAVHQHVHKEQQENESDLRQQIENVSNKSDLQHQRQKQEEQQKEMELASTAATAANTTTTINTISITKNSNSNLPHKQYQHQQQQENEKNYHHYHLSQPQQQTEKNFKEERQIANTCNPYVNIEDRQMQSSISASMLSSFQRIDDDEHSERPTLNASDKYSNETLLVEKKEEDIEYSTTYSSLYNKLSSSHSAKCQINFENSSVNITPISSPTYGDNTIASPSPVRKSMDFRMGGEIDGRLTYPPIPYILHEIDLAKIEINKPLDIDKLKKTIQMDPRIFRTHIKKQLMTLCKPTSKTSSTNALVPFNTTNFSQSPSAGSSMMVSPYDPRSRTPATIMNADMAGHQNVLNPYNHMNITPPSSSSSSYMQNDMLPNAVPLALQYHSTMQPILQPQQQQTPNMFLYGCLQRSPWYQSLMSTMKIQINQSISQLVRVLNNFHRERLINPELVFDVFKIDCAGELLEIMRNLGIFVDANGIINEKRHMPTFGGRSCCNTMPVNATYSFIQQVLTPNTHCTSMTTASSSYNTAGTVGDGSTVVSMNEPFVSCYIKAPETPQQKPLDNCCTSHHHHQHQQHSNSQEDKHINNNNSYANNNCNCCHKTCNNNNGNNCCGNSDNNKNNNNSDSYGGGSSYSQNNNNSNNRRFGGGFGDNKFKKPYDSNYNNNENNSYRSSNQRSSYSNNPRFSKPGSSSPSRSTNNSPPNSPRGGGGGGTGGFRGGRGGAGRFNNNRRFNNYNNNDKFNNGGGGGGSSWFSNNDSNDNRYNKFDNNNSPTRATSPNASLHTGSPGAAVAKNSSPPARKVSGGRKSSDEECWD